MYSFEGLDGQKTVNDTGAGKSSEKGTLKGNAKIEDGVLKLDGSGDWLDLEWKSDTTDAFLEKSISISFKADSTSGTQVLYEEGATLRGLNVYIKDGNICVSSWNLQNGEAKFGPVVMKTPLPNDGEWHNITLSLDGGDYRKVDGSMMGYLDGEPFPLGSVTKGTELPDGSVRAGDLGGHNGAEIGYASATFIDGKRYGTGAYFKGEIEFVSVLDNAVDENQAKDIFNASKAGDGTESTGSSREYSGIVSKIVDDAQEINNQESINGQNVEKDVSELDSDTTLSSNDDKLTLSDDANTNDLSSISSTDFGDGIDTLIIEDDLIMDFDSLAADAFKNLEV